MNTQKIMLIGLLGLLLNTGCVEDEYNLENEQQIETTSYDIERQTLSNRVDWLNQAIQAENLSPECRAEEIEALVADIENWNANSIAPNIGLSYTTQPLPPKGPTGPRQPCLLLPCDPIRVSNGWVCFNTGTAGCNARGIPICTYVCVRIAGP